MYPWVKGGKDQESYGKGSDAQNEQPSSGMGAQMKGKKGKNIFKIGGCEKGGIAPGRNTQFGRKESRNRT